MIVENARREFAEGPLSAVTTDAHRFPSLVRSAPTAAIFTRQLSTCGFDPTRTFLIIRNCVQLTRIRHRLEGIADARFKLTVSATELRMRQRAGLFDDLVGLHQDSRRDGNSERPGGL